MKKLFALILCFTVYSIPNLAFEMQNQDVLENESLHAIRNYLNRVDESTIISSFSLDLPTFDTTINYISPEETLRKEYFGNVKPQLLCLVCKVKCSAPHAFKKHVERYHLDQSCHTDIRYCSLCLTEKMHSLKLKGFIAPHQLVGSFSYSHLKELAQHYNQFEHTNTPNQIALNFMRQKIRLKKIYYRNNVINNISVPE